MTHLDPRSPGKDSAGSIKRFATVSQTRAVLEARGLFRGFHPRRDCGPDLRALGGATEVVREDLPRLQDADDGGLDCRPRLLEGALLPTASEPVEHHLD